MYGRKRRILKECMDMCVCLYMYNIFKNTKIKAAKNIRCLFCYYSLFER